RAAAAQSDGRLPPVQSHRQRVGGGLCRNGRTGRGGTPRSGVARRCASSLGRRASRPRHDHFRPETAMSWRASIAALLLAAALGACDGSEQVAEAPPPETAMGDVTGYFCGMLLTEHGGPKGQIHLASRDEPVWFSSVRDTVAFTLLAESPKDIAAIYVNDMGRATDWEQPEPGTWVEARSAWFVIGSRRVGGMGLPEAVPFGTETAAASFAAENGGRIARFAEIPEDYVFGTPDLPAPTEDDHATP